MTQSFMRITIVAMVLCLIGGCASNRDLMAKELRPPTPPPPVPKRINEPINNDLRDRARGQILEFARSNDPELRCNAIEAMQNALGISARQQIVPGLNDAHPAVRFAATMACGTLRLSEARPMLLEMAKDANRGVQVAVRYALHHIGDTHLSHDLEQFAIDPDPYVRGNTAMVLGLLGEKSGVNILHTMVSDRSPLVRIQVAEALWRLHDDEGLENLVAASVSQYADDQILGVLGLAAPRDQQVRGHLYGKLVSDYPEVSLAAARAMGQLDSDEGYTIAINATRSGDARQRSMAALALGAIGRSDAQGALARLLKDSAANVRLAASTAILQLKSPAA